jgi:Protein of unknown function (DUF3515)
MRTDRRRRAALTASAIAIPLTIILAFALSSAASEPERVRSDPGAPFEVAAPPIPPLEVQRACITVLSAVPIQVGELVPRLVRSASPFVQAWGDPPVIVRCGVSRPFELTPGSAAFIVDINGVEWLPRQTRTATVFTVIDRSVYVEVTVPNDTAEQPMPVFSDAVALLQRVCESQNYAGTVPETRLCTHRH